LIFNCHSEEKSKVKRQKLKVGREGKSQKAKPKSDPAENRLKKSPNKNTDNTLRLCAALRLCVQPQTKRPFHFLLLPFNF
jgi:hypothetical protein